jgi:uncharacterized protein YkwD
MRMALDFLARHWPDALAAFALIYYAIDGWRRGGANLLFDVIGFFLGMSLAFLFHGAVGGLYVRYLHVSLPFAGALGFITIWVLAEAVYPLAARRLYAALPHSWRSSPVNAWVGVVFGVANAALVCALVFSLLLSLPFPSALKKQVSGSAVGGYIVAKAASIEIAIDSVFGGAVRESLTFLTVHPDSGASLDLGFRTTSFAPDPDAEAQMLGLVNAERISRGLKPLVPDATIAAVARRHSADMLERGYFAHVNPDGLDPADRADAALIRYDVYGENLAFAPDIKIAHDGLMDSPGHRANILSPSFHRIGIGVEDAGIYGLVITQDFAD